MPRSFADYKFHPVKVHLHWSVPALFSPCSSISFSAYTGPCPRPSSTSAVSVQWVHRLYMASALICYFMKDADQCKHTFRHRENFWAFTGPKRDFGLILLILNMIIHGSFTGPTHLLSANVRGPVSFAVSVPWYCITALIKMSSILLQLHTSLLFHVRHNTCNKQSSIKP